MKNKEHQENGRFTQKGLQKLIYHSEVYVIGLGWLKKVPVPMPRGKRKGEFSNKVGVVADEKVRKGINER